MKQDVGRLKVNQEDIRAVSCNVKKNDTKTWRSMIGKMERKFTFFLEWPMTGSFFVFLFIYKVGVSRSCVCFVLEEGIFSFCCFEWVVLWADNLSLASLWAVPGTLLGVAHLPVHCCLCKHGQVPHQADGVVGAVYQQVHGKFSSCVHRLCARYNV